VARSDVIAGALSGDLSAAKASAAIVYSLRRHPAARVPHGTFPRGGGALVAVLGKVRIGTPRQDVNPCSFEVGARLLEGWRNTLTANTPVAADLIQRPDARAVSINGRFDCEKVEYCNFSKGSTLHTSGARKFRAVG
jgi:hypothetical protein